MEFNKSEFLSRTASRTESDSCGIMTQNWKWCSVDKWKPTDARPRKANEIRLMEVTVKQINSLIVTFVLMDYGLIQSENSMENCYIWFLNKNSSSHSVCCRRVDEEQVFPSRRLHTNKRVPRVRIEPSSRTNPFWDGQMLLSCFRTAAEFYFSDRDSHRREILEVGNRSEGSLRRWVVKNNYNFC